MKATFSLNGSKSNLMSLKEETERMRRSSVPFGMNSPKDIGTSTSEMSATRFSRFRTGLGGLSPAYDMAKT